MITQARALAATPQTQGQTRFEWGLRFIKPGVAGAIISVGKFAAIPFCSWCDSDPFPHRVASIH